MVNLVNLVAQASKVGKVNLLKRKALPNLELCRHKKKIGHDVKLCNKRSKNE